MPVVRRHAAHVLDTRVKDLGLTLEKSRFHSLIRETRRELRAAKIALDPIFYLSTEYGCLEGSATIGLLWTDGFDFSWELAKKHHIRTRTPPIIIKTLRHEVGHAFGYAHKLYRTPLFRELFGVKGPFFDSYPEVWKPGKREHKRLERGEVILLYATRHADEDWAVCFEHWLTARTEGWDWRERYHGKPLVLAKLGYVEEVVHDYGQRRAKVKPPPLDEPVSSVRLTVRDWMDSVVKGTNYNLHVGSAVGT
jgi:hypothetical protein